METKELREINTARAEMEANIQNTEREKHKFAEYIQNGAGEMIVNTLNSNLNMPTPVKKKKKYKIREKISKFIKTVETIFGYNNGDF